MNNESLQEALKNVSYGEFMERKDEILGMSSEKYNKLSAFSRFEFNIIASHLIFMGEIVDGKAFWSGLEKEEEA